MLIINADDWGKDRKTTDNITICYKNDRISSTSAMIFMQDSERAARLALENNFDVGLHLNFTESFTSKHVDNKLLEYQQILTNFFTCGKYARVFYNPIIKKQLEYSFRTQYDEFLKLYAKPPTHIDGHHHIHLCTNIIWGKLIPPGTKIRRNFTGTDSMIFVNKLYLWIVNQIIVRRYKATDSFYMINLNHKDEWLIEIIKQSLMSNVELMLHPGRDEEFYYLMSSSYYRIISGIYKGSYKDLYI